MSTESSQTIIQQMLTTTPPDFSCADAASLAADLYGIEASAQTLVSERDQNFQLTARNDVLYTLKISNQAEQLKVIDFQNQALVHVATVDPSFPLPRVIPALDGRLHSQVEHDGKTHFVRVLSWLEGSVIHDTSIDAKLARRLGRLLARLGLAFKDFDHPGSNPPSLWDMKRAAKLADLTVHIDDPQLKPVIEKILNKFVSQVQPALKTLRSQVIHNDLNPGNVLMDRQRPDQISGVIDFGDLIKSPLIIDLAVAAAYQLNSGNDPLEGALPMIAGYHSVTPLLDLELELLTDLIRTRLITSLLIGSYRAALFPENREYLLISQRSARDFLLNINHLPADEALARIHAACLSTG
jgi:Ser/Thr protein kinase RdoA (MazF antagonist)